MKRKLHPSPSRERWLDLRRRNLNSSEVAALFGLSPYLTEFEVWHQKNGTLSDVVEENARMTAGTFLEPAIAQLAAHTFGFQSAPFKDYVEIPDLRLGASFDWRIASGWTGAAAEGEGIHEVKNVDYLQFAGRRDRVWNADDPDDIKAPPHIEIQVQHQLLVTGYQWAAITPLVGGNDIRCIIRIAREGIQSKIRDRAAAFWQSIEDGAEPDPDFDRDHDTLKSLYAVPDARAALPLELQGEAMDSVAGAIDAAARKKAAEAEEKTFRARIMATMGPVEVAELPNGARITWKANKKGVRSLRLTPAPVDQEDAA